MSAHYPERRKMTAREAAQRLGRSERYIRSVAAEPRAEYLARSAARQRQALELKDQGLTYRQIGERMNCTTKAAEHLVHRARLTYRQIAD